MDPPSSRRNLTVLLWHWPFSKALNLSGDVCWDSYGVPGCRLLDRRSSFFSADVVVFHNRELIQGQQKLPLDLPRPPGQRWAWMSLEAPDYNGNLQRFANIFNMTISYRRDADIRVPYGEKLPRGADGDLTEDLQLNKSSLLCWVVSNYRGHHRRSRAYRELSAELPVQVYGRWTKTPLPSAALLPTISRCFFYLAWENSESRDYITEKLWRNAYQGRAVPVVLGPPVSDYRAVAPPRSFIHVDEFPSLKDLGTFLQRLARDEERYAHFFSWRRRWRVKVYTDWRERLCQICSQYQALPPHRVYCDLQAWARGAGTGCVQGPH